MNKTTACLAPDVPVKEIDNVFRRVLKFRDSIAEGEVVMLAKIYLSYGLWRMIVEEEAKWNFSYVMTELTDMPPSLVVPSALQMGWSESPEYFCAATETGRDLIH